MFFNLIFINFLIFIISYYLIAYYYMIANLYYLVINNKFNYSEFKKLYESKFTTIGSRLTRLYHSAILYDDVLNIKNNLNKGFLGIFVFLIKEENIYNI